MAPILERAFHMDADDIGDLQRDCERLWDAGAEFERERARGLVDALNHLSRELNNGQCLEPNGPNHAYIERELTSYDTSPTKPNKE